MLKDERSSEEKSAVRFEQPLPFGERPSTTAVEEVITINTQPSTAKQDEVVSIMSSLRHPGQSMDLDEDRDSDRLSGNNCLVVGLICIHTRTHTRARTYCKRNTVSNFYWASFDKFLVVNIELLCYDLAYNIKLFT